MIKTTMEIPESNWSRHTKLVCGLESIYPQRQEWRLPGFPSEGGHPWPRPECCGGCSIVGSTPELHYLAPSSLRKTAVTQFTTQRQRDKAKMTINDLKYCYDSQEEMKLWRWQRDERNTATAFDTWQVTSTIRRSWTFFFETTHTQSLAELTYVI